MKFLDKISGSAKKICGSVKKSVGSLKKGSDKERKAPEVKEKVARTEEKNADKKKKASETMKKAADSVKKLAASMKKGAVYASAETKTKIISSIKLKLLVSFMVPVLLVMILGFSSYERSKSALIKSFRDTASSTVKSTGNYFDLISQIVESKAEQVLSLTTINSYFGNAFEKGSDDEKKAKTAISSQVKQVANSDDISVDVSIVSYSVNKSMSSNGAYLIIGDTGANKFDASDDGKIFEALGEKQAWIGRHTFIDEFGFTDKDYSMVFARAFYDSLGDKLGYVFADVSTETVMKALSQIDLGNTATFSLVTQDGCETTRNGLTGQIFYGTKFYNKAVASEEITGSDYEKIDGTKYLCLYYKIGNTGAMICGRIAEKEIVRTAESIKLITMIITILCVVVSTLIGLIVSLSLSNSIDQTVGILGLAAEGDLRNRIRSTRKDELGKLSNATDKMLHNTKKLIVQATNASDALNTSSGELLESASELKDSATRMNTSIDEIKRGITMQASDASDCLADTEVLNEKIDDVRKNVNAIEGMAESATSAVSEGVRSVDELKSKADQTASVTKTVITDIQALAGETKAINQIVETINDIATQTNLLSLNASIEAARSGDAGRGFAVVANEIRVLADQSKQAANEIRKIIGSIVKRTGETVVSAKQADDIVTQQGAAVESTLKKFTVIEESVGNIAGNIADISRQVKEIEHAKEHTVSAVQSISSVLHETEAMAEELEKSSRVTKEEVESLNAVIASLKGEAGKLKEELNSFKI